MPLELVRIEADLSTPAFRTAEADEGMGAIMVKHKLQFKDK